MITRRGARLLRAVAGALAIIVLLLPATATAAGDLPAQPSPSSDILQDKLLVIELFFLLIGLAVAFALGFLIWQAWRRKKEKEKKEKR